ncbi:histidine kinase [Actinophytocola glycyrrhizae]|uniref:Histidine kinase n=1 Tax=Actinophytocola glycyrrhizae TaxID=2044873 RepID=A0ABV9RUE7_9PSEU
MRTVEPDETDDVGAVRELRGARAVVLGFLGTLLAGRAVDAFDHGELWFALFVMAPFVLPIWFASGVARRQWTRLRWWLLGVQAVLTYLPFALFGNGWVGGISGLLAGLVLLTVSAPASWFWCGALVVAEEVLWLGVVGPPYTPAVHAALWLLIAFANNGLALFGLTWLAELVRQIASTRDKLAAAAVTRQRLAVAERLRSMIGDRVQAVTDHAKAARTALPDRPDLARAEVAAAGVTTREMLAEARAIAADPDERIGARQETGVVLAPRLATGVLLAVLVLFATQNVANVALPGGTGYPVGALVVAVVTGIAITALQLRHSDIGGDGRPPAWRWSFAAQAVLTYVQYPLLGAAGLAFAGFLAGSALLLFPDRVRWVWFGAIVASMPVLVLITPGGSLRWTGYATATAVAFGLLVYGLAWLTRLAVRMTALREELAELAAVRERLRLARDTHDLLGLGLSAMALKTDLVAALIGRDDARVRCELDELVWLCAKAGNDARLVASADLRLSFASELGLTFDILTSAGIAVRLPDRPPPMSEEVDVVLATVVREAVTNILRHSAALHCTITLAVTEGTLRLRVGNDGLVEEAAPGTGSGLANLRARVEMVGGRFTARCTGREFEVVAELPYS